MNKYDRVIQENIQPLTLSLARKISSIHKAEISILPRKMQRTLEKEADTILELTLENGKKAIGNIEWQLQNDPYMHERMLLQQSILYSKYKLPVIGIVIYAGKDPVNMITIIEYDNFFYRYELIDMSTFDPYELINSNIPEEVIMAILAGRPNIKEARLLIKNILIKLQTLLRNDTNELKRKIAQLEILSEAKEFQNIIIEEEHIMPFILDNNKSIRFQQGLEQGTQNATRQRNTAFVESLLKNTTHSIEEIAKLVNVPVEFVLNIRQQLGKS